MQTVISYFGKGKYSCMADILSYLFEFAKVELTTDLLVWSNPNQ